MKNILLLFLFLSFAYSQELQKIKLQLQWKHQFEFAGFYAAKQQGYYKKYGLDVEFIEFNSKMNIVNEVLKGNADYGLSYSTLIADYMKGQPIVFIANFFKQSPLVLVTQKNIHTPADMKGKKIMGLLDGTHKQIILTMLDKFNVTENDFINITRKFSIKSFINKEVDALSIFTTNEIYTLDKLGIQYNILDPAVFGTKFYDLNLFTSKSELQNNPDRVKNFRKASIEGWEYALKHKEEIADLIMKKYNTQNKTKEALLFEANQIEYLMLTNVYPIGSIDLERVETIADSFSQSMYMQKESREELEDFIYKAKKNTLELTTKQKEYLQQKKVLKLCVDPNWMPLEKIEEGRHIGLAADIIQLISKKINIPLQLIKTNNWSETLDKVKKRECDILSLAAKTPSRKEYLDFTTPYVKIPLVVATKTGVPFSDNLNKLKEKPLGVVKNYSIYELLKAKYPNINLVEVGSVKEGLDFIEQEKIFGLLDNSIVINDTIQRDYLHNKISITGQFPESFHLSIASRNDEPILHNILEKALLSIDRKTKDQIIIKWTNLKYQVKTDYRIIVQLIFITLVLISIFIYWNLKLKDEIKKKEMAKKKLQDSEEKFRTLFNVAPVLLNAFDEKGKVVLWNKECEKVFGWKKEDIIKVENPLSMFYPKKEDQQKVLDSLKEIQYNIYQEWHPQTKNGENIITMWANIKLPNNEVINLGYDITKQRAYEYSLNQKTEQLAIAKKQLEELNNSLEEKIELEIEKSTKHQMILMHQSKLAQMGEMIENIAHQWRQPLAQINSSVLLIDAVLSKNKFEDNTIENKLLEIESLTSYMSKTIDDFKNFFNPNKQKSIFKIESAIEKAYDVVKGSLNIHQIKITKNINKELKCKSYIYELQQVILTLLNNAIDALVIMDIRTPEIIISVYESNNNIIITIEDNALGIKEDLLEKIFVPYFTTKHKSQGTGLGLYMAKLIIEDGLNGKLKVENKQHGACFIIEIEKGIDNG
ncbi:ABC transporter substrate-binding protein [Arcobacter sp. KX21116]|uniref:ABC transporter substrate-binding protein n=1 Tax=Arcobacter iocasae TaxID=2906515 RepID=UPI0035D42B55